MQATDHAAAFEQAIQRRGRQLLHGVEPEHHLRLSPAWLQEQLMQWAAQDPAFRVKLLRFVDVLPALRSNAAVADHVQQYFHDGAPAPVRVGSTLAAARPLRPVLSRVVRASVSAMAERFVGGATPAQTLPKLVRLLEEGTAYTVDLLGEATLSEEEADAYLRRYLALISGLATLSTAGDRLLAQPNISVKLSSLTSHFEPAAPATTSAAVRQRLLPLLHAAREAGVFVNVDMEQYRFRDLTLDILEDTLGSGVLAAWSDAGIVVQAYLRDAAEELERLQALARRRGAPITVRLVKGAYWDEEVVLAQQESRRAPVFEEKGATDASYERCSALLVAAYPALRPAFATHNPRSITQAIVRVEQAAIPRADVEFQMLYGMADGLRKAVRAEGYRTRVYVPSGEIIPGMAYLVRRLLENTSNESWLLHPQEAPDPETALAAPEPEPVDPRSARTAGFGNHPPAEWYRAEQRDAMQQALTSVRAAFGAKIAPLIDGQPAATRQADQVHPPAHPAELMAVVGRAEAEQVRSAVAAARGAFPGWRDTAPIERAALLRRAAALMDERRFTLAATMVYECAKPWSEADGDVCEAIDFLKYYAQEAERLGRGIELSSVPGETNKLSYEGRGVVAVIAPWNFPLSIITGMTGGALAGGCTAILKPAEQSPVIAAALVGALHEAGIPPAVVQYLPGAGEVLGPALVEHPDVAMIAFTGSNAVGLEIVERAAVRRPAQPGIKQVIAELGGKNAIVVDDDADLDVAVAGIVRSAFGYAGQKCSACSRVYVVGSAYPAFRDRLAGAVRSLVVGPPEDPYTQVPPVISVEAKASIERYVALGTREGRLLVRGNSPAGDGYYVAPHVFEGIPPRSALACEEVFGPLLLLDRVRSFEEGLQRAVGSPFALTGGVFSRNPRNIERARREFRVGNLYINRPVTGAMVGRQPFAGFGMSGTGDKTGGPDYVRRFMLSRVVTENTMRRGFAPPER